MERNLKIVHHDRPAPVAKWAPVTWQHPNVRPENRPDPRHPQRMTAAQKSQHLHGERQRPQAWPLFALMIMVMGGVMVAAALS
jgi:hypothetical protein